jgi:hypothetical protein
VPRRKIYSRRRFLATSATAAAVTALEGQRAEAQNNAGAASPDEPPGAGDPGSTASPADRSGPSDTAKRGARERPNILWLVSEDNNPFIGAYGD